MKSWKWLKNFLIVAIIFVLWFIFSRHSNPLFLPQPEKVWQDIVDLTKNGMLGMAIYKSFTRITVATMLASAISIPVGLLVANYPWADDLITPITGFSRYIPVTVFYPLCIMWFGIDELMKVMFLFIAVFFFFLPSVVLAVKETPVELTDTAYTMGMNSWQVMTGVLFPYSFPSICQNFLLAYGTGWTYVIIVEVINSRWGLGHIINLGSARGRTDLVFASVLVIIAISIVFDLVGKKIVRWAFPWKYTREISGG
jgi:NitT/TauT family transport system permease protein